MRSPPGTAPHFGANDDHNLDDEDDDPEGLEGEEIEDYTPQ